MSEPVIAQWFLRSDDPPFALPSPVLPGDPLLRFIARLPRLSSLEWAAIAAFGRRNRAALLKWCDVIDSAETEQDACFRLLLWLAAHDVGPVTVKEFCMRAGGRDALAAVLGAGLALAWPGEFPADLRGALLRPFELAGLGDA
jgi:hypothetical protein